MKVLLPAQIAVSSAVSEGAAEGVAMKRMCVEAAVDDPHPVTIRCACIDSVSFWRIGPVLKFRSPPFPFCAAPMGVMPRYSR